MKKNETKPLIRLMNPIDQSSQQKMEFDFYNLMTQTINSQNAVCSSLNQMSTSVAYSNELLLKNMEAMLEKSERRHRNKRAKRVGAKLNASQGDFLKVVYYYDTGEAQDYILINNLSGTFGVYKLKIKGFEPCHMFAILFPNEGIFIIGDISKVKAAYLYECFLRAGACFDFRVPKNIAVKVLHEFFAPLIEMTNQEFQINSLAGWNANYFQHAGRFIWKNQMSTMELPVLKKEFAYLEPNAKLFKEYFLKLNCIKERHERALISVLPFIGILSSILNRNENLSSFFVNFVVLENIELKKLCDLLQVFNRSKLIPKSLDRSQKSLQELARNSNDEVLIVNALYDETDTVYKCGKMHKNAMSLANKFLRKECVGDDFESGNVFLVTVAARRIFHSNCKNIIVTSDTFESNNFIHTHVGKDAVACVFSTFVIWAEKNMEVIEQMVRKKREEADGRKLLLDIVQDIVELFWKEEGYSLIDELKLPIEHRIASIFDMDYEEDDLLERFKILIHSYIGKFEIINRLRGCQHKMNAIYVDSDYVYFPVNVIDRILGKAGLFPYKREIFLDLQKQKMLKREPDRITKKVTIGGKTCDYYVIKQDFFEELGVKKITGNLED